MDMHPLAAKYGVKTDVIDAFVIRQTISLGDQVINRVMDTSEAQLRDALVALGWSPPQ